jgi:hypothetical protein
VIASQRDVPIGCVAAWIAFATALVIGLVRLNGWATPHA